MPVERFGAMPPPTQVGGGRGLLWVEFSELSIFGCCRHHFFPVERVDKMAIADILGKLYLTKGNFMKKSCP